MGVPAFFRWLTRKYPSVIVHCVEQKTVDINGVKIPINTSEENPNGVEFDNLYLDMNGIIHPCTHPEDKPAPRNEDEMMIAIFECIDRLFAIVRPRKLLYMAIDGVAPRAKMNQQRSRRFRASKEVVEKVNEISRIRAVLQARGAWVPPVKPKEEHFDSNCITPGTPFMARLSICLDYYIHERLNNDPGWSGIKVILSDANVPGEGEHKIMDFIRKQRAQPDHDPNTQHCLCGADADLIMLGLATHEPNFTIIREEFKPNKPRPCDICGQIGHEMADCVGAERSIGPDDISFGSEGEFIFVRLNVLREYLERDMEMINLPFKYDFERVVDDWVFMCFFVGNDFLPHLPSLEIREGAIDRLIGLYKDAVYKTGGYLTDSGDVNLERVQLIMTQLGRAEDEIFKRRQQNELNFKAREKAKRRRSDGFNEHRPNWSMVKDTQFEAKTTDSLASVINARQAAYHLRHAALHSERLARPPKPRINLNDGGSSESGTSSRNDDSRKGIKRKFDDTGEEFDDDDQAHDEVRLWEDGFKDRYYESKFDVGRENVEFRYSVALHYVRGLCWVLRYYYQGCASWKWYFPYHYAPFASDFVNIAGLSTEFETDTVPFQPLEQLMGVFPAASGQHVPEPWRHLMLDSESTIIDLYPDDFKIDLNGKKFAWQGVALLPFVDEKRLFKALKPFYSTLTDAERKRNVRGDDRMYLTLGNRSYGTIKGLYDQNIDPEQEASITIDGMRGTVLLADDCIGLGGTVASPVADLSTITDNNVYYVRFRDPKYPIGFTFPAIKLKDAKAPPRVLKPQDLDPEQSRNWRPQVGMAPATQRAHLGQPGHRMVDHYNREANFTNSNLNAQRNNYNPGLGHNRGYRGSSGGGAGFSGRGSYQGAGGSGQGGPYGRGGNYGNSYNSRGRGGNFPNRGGRDDRERQFMNAPDPYNNNNNNNRNSGGGGGYRRF